MNIARANGASSSQALQHANEEMSRAVFGPATEGFSQVAGMMSPWGMTWMMFVPPPLQPAFLGMVYLQGTAKGIQEAPLHYMNAMQLYVKAAQEGAVAATRAA